MVSRYSLVMKSIVYSVIKESFSIYQMHHIQLLYQHRQDNDEQYQHAFFGNRVEARARNTGEPSTLPFPSNNTL